LDLAGTVLDWLEQRIRLCDAASNHVLAHTWYTHMANVEHCLRVAGPGAVRRQLSNTRESSVQDLEASLAAMDILEYWLSAVQPNLPQAVASTSQSMQVCKRLRTKMWYVADVRASSTYDNVRAMASGLRVMGNTTKGNKDTSPMNVPSLRHATSTRTPYQVGHLKSEAQVLELLGTSLNYGGPNKLSDEQASIVSSWIKRVGIRMVCPGEERLHKLCMEVRKSVDALTMTSAPDGLQLWSSILFAHEQPAVVPNAQTGLGLSGLAPSVRRFESLRLQTIMPPSIDAVSNTSHTLSSSNSRDYFDTRSPTLTTKSSATFWSPAMSEVHSPSSATSVGSYEPKPQSHRQAGSAAVPATGVSTVELLRDDLTGLLLSDLGAGVFNEGCEADVAFWTGLGGGLTKVHMESSSQAWASMLDSVSAKVEVAHRRRPPFDYGHAFKNLLCAFTHASDPLTKLEQLGKVQILLRPCMVRLAKVSRNKSLGDHSQKISPSAGSRFGTQSCIDGFYRLFCNSNIRPPYLLRDLQCIASLIPSATLDSRPESDAFRNAVAAISRIKKEACQLFIETADSIIAHHTNARGHSRTASQAQQKRDDASFPIPSSTPPLESFADYQMEDAAYLLQIAAKEGLPTAQRELATLYLTHPTLMDRVLSPFALPKEVFREELEGKTRRNRDVDRYDPGTMCVAIHWMIKAAGGGDALAKEYLRQREDLERLP
jgi:hypothetical protein